MNGGGPQRYDDAPRGGGPSAGFRLFLIIGGLVFVAVVGGVIYGVSAFVDKKEAEAQAQNELIWKVQQEQRKRAQNPYYYEALDKAREREAAEAEAAVAAANSPEARIAALEKELADYKKMYAQRVRADEEMIKALRQELEMARSELGRALEARERDR